MEIKRNEATLNRPEGDRVIDAPYVFIDIPAFVDQLKDEKAWDKNDRNGITVFKSDNMTIVLTALQKKAELGNNMVDGFLTVHILKGKVRFTTPDGDIDANKNKMIAFHPGVCHSIRAKSNAVLLITNYSVDEKDSFLEKDSFIEKDPVL